MEASRQSSCKIPSIRSAAAVATLLVLFAVSCRQSTDGLDTTVPDDNRFTTVVLTKPGELDEPMEMAFTGDGRLLLVERKGNVKSVDLKTNVIKVIGFIPVNRKYTSKEGRVTEAEEGLMGIAVHPDFNRNHWVYLYYADTAVAKHVLARWELQGDSLVQASKKILLEIPTQRETCCHTGGGMVFDGEGNLFLTTGNNTGNPTAGTSGLDERPGRESWDDQRTAGNTNDLRGKILRIHPEDDGTYSIPEGNLFPPGTPKTRPEIYTMGHRNPWRVSIDSKTGFIYWGEVGPDASKDSIIGPRGLDEFNQARGPGFFGWPYFIGDNKAYSMFDYATDQVGEKFNPEHPVNKSPNNTGLVELPLPQKAFIWYPYSNSAEFPLVGSSGRSATGGPVFRRADFDKGANLFPGYFEGKWLIVDFMRGWIMTVAMDDEGNYKSMERFLPREDFTSAIDMKFGPDGYLYVLKYGSAWFRGNQNAQLVRVEYNGGNRKPIAKATADKVAGAIPLTVNLSSAGTMDYDDYDSAMLRYEWNIRSEKGFHKTLTEPDPVVTFDSAGVYTVTFSVTDTKGEKNSQSFEIKAGNDPPSVKIELTKGNTSFFFPASKLEYRILVEDKEDGSLANGSIQPNEVAINFDYVPAGFDLIEIAQNRKASDDWATFSTGQNLIARSDCKSCHIADKKSVGPSYQEIAQRYKNDATGQERIARKIIEGGSGVWGEHAMSAHPQISQQDATTIVKYIISIGEQKATVRALPVAGTFVPVVPAGDNGKGGFLLRAAYEDKGTRELASLASEYIIPLRNPVLDPDAADMSRGILVMTTPSRSFNMVGPDSYVGFRSLDLTGINQIDFLVQASPRSGSAGGNIEVHMDSPDGPLLGQTSQVVPKEIDFRRLMANSPPPANGKAAATQPQPVDFAARRRRMSTVASATLEPAEGLHDIYFVFKNSSAASNQVIMQVLEIQFQNGVRKNKGKN